MDYSKYDPSKPMVFIIAFLLGGIVLGPISNAFINWADLSEESAIGFGATMFSVTLGAIVIWWRIKISSQQHIEAMEVNKYLHTEKLNIDRAKELKSYIIKHGDELRKTRSKLEIFSKCNSVKELGELKSKNLISEEEIGYLLGLDRALFYHTRLLSMAIFNLLHGVYRNEQEKRDKFAEFKEDAMALHNKIAHIFFNHELPPSQIPKNKD